MSLQWPSRLLGALLLLSLLLSSCGPSLAKKPKEYLNTDCTNKDQMDEILYYVERPYTNDSACTRYAWSTVGYPTLFISQDLTKCDCKYSLNEAEYMKNKSSGVKINGTGSYFSLAIVFTRLIEFQVDSKKPKSYTAFNVTDACDDQYISMNLSNGTLDWVFDDDYTVVGEAGKFSFTIKMHYPSAVEFERLSQFPRAQVSENATLIDITIQNYEFHGTSPDGKGGRLALELFVVHGPKVKPGEFQQHQSLDDEYTPSVFSSWTYNVSGDNSKFHDLGGYIHWKPISYQSKGRKSTESQQINLVPTADVDACTNYSSLEGLAAALFGSNASNVTRWYAVFGTDGDDTYLSPKYSTWTLVVGYGKVPHDGLSFTVIITIIVGLGIPGALVILGGVYVFIKKKPWQNVNRMIAKARGRDGYQAIG